MATDRELVRLTNALDLGGTKTKKRFVPTRTVCEIMTDNIPQYSDEERDKGLGLGEGQVWAKTNFGWTKLDRDEYEPIEHRRAA